MKHKAQLQSGIRTFGKSFLAVAAFSLLTFDAREVFTQESALPEVLRGQLLSQLTTEGLAITETQREILPSPLLIPGQSADARQQLLENLSGAAGWERFSRNSAVAPTVIDIDYIKDAVNERIGHRIHVVFVAHANLSRFRDRDFMQQTFGQPGEQKSREGFSFEELKPVELKELGIEVKNENEEGFAFIEANLLSRVKVRGVIRTEAVQQDSSLVIAWCLDARFGSHPQRSGASSKLVTDDSGKVSEQSPQPYSGCGGYLSLTQLDPASDVVLIESWTLLHEPSDWFQGSNLLRSKLPLTIQEGVRNFRRKLAKQDSSTTANP